MLAVTMYGVVTTGFNTGLAAAGLLTPAVGVHVKAVPLLTVFALKDEPVQIVVSLCKVSRGNAFTVTVNVFEAVQPDPKPAVTV